MEASRILSPGIATGQYFKAMRITLIFALLVIAQAADAPKLTDAQIVPILRAQRDLLGLEAEKVSLESRLKDLNYSLIPQARQGVERLMKASTPEGYSMQPDLTLRAVPVKPMAQ